MVSMTFLYSYRVENVPPEDFLYKAGYLTIVGYDDFGYISDYPNMEVKYSLSELILTESYKIKNDVSVTISDYLYEGLLKKDPNRIKKGLNFLFANIPYNLHINRESFYHSLIYTALLMCGLNARNEDPNNIGRSDIVVEYFDKVRIIEMILKKEKLKKF